ncbi:unnamed protein product [Auanema sp. JU1783]|nr:unnamed protein product [Auanema sp. JU1783]
MIDQKFDLNTCVSLPTRYGYLCIVEVDRKSSDFGEKKESGLEEKKTSLLGESSSEKLVVKRAPRLSVFGDPRESGLEEKKTSLLGESSSEKLVAKRAPRSSGSGEKKEGGFRSGDFGEKKGWRIVKLIELFEFGLATMFSGSEKKKKRDPRFSDFAGRIESGFRSGDFGEKKESSSGEKKSSLLRESSSEKLVAKRARVPQKNWLQNVLPDQVSSEILEMLASDPASSQKTEIASLVEEEVELLDPVALKKEESSSEKLVAKRAPRSSVFGEKEEKVFGSVSSEDDEENAFGSVSSEEDNEVGFGSVTSEEDEEGGFESCGLGEKKEGGFESVTAEKDERLVLVISMSYLQSVGSREKKFLRIVKLYREVPGLEDCFGEKKEDGFGSGGLGEKRDGDFGARREQEFGVGGFGDGKSILMSACFGSLDADQFHWFESTGLESDRSRFLYFPIQEIVDIVENGHCVACSWYNSPKTKFGCSFTEKFIIPFLFRFCPYCSERWCESNQCISSLLNEFVLHAEIKGPGSGYSLRS